VNGTTASRHDDSHAEALSSLDCQAGVWVLGTGAPAVGEAPKEGTIDLPVVEPTGCLVYGEGPEASLELSGLLPYRVATDRSAQ
jgi:hypothetical protein